MKGALLRCSVVAQREEARARRESRGSFHGVFSGQIPFLPVGWLTVTLESCTNPPVDQSSETSSLSFVVRAAGSEQATGTLTGWPEVFVLSSFVFEVPRAALKDRAQQVVIEVHDSRGMYGTTGVSLWRIVKGDQDADGTYDLFDADQPSIQAIGLNGPSSVRLRFSYQAAPNRNLGTAQPMLYSRPRAIPFTDKDMGLKIPAKDSMGHSAYGAPEQVVQGSLAGRGKAGMYHRPRSASPALYSLQAQTIGGGVPAKAGGNSNPQRPQSAFASSQQHGRQPLRPQSAGPPAHHSQSLRPQSATQREPTVPMAPNDGDQSDAPATPQVPARQRPQSAHPQGREEIPMQAGVQNRPLSAGASRPQSAGPSRPVKGLPPGTKDRFNQQPKAPPHADVKEYEATTGKVNHIPISQPATLHLYNSPLAEDEDVIDDDEEVFSPDGDSRLSKEGQNIIEEIQASATGFEQVEPLLGMTKQHIVEIVGQLFRRFDMERKGRMSFKNAHAAILLLTGRGLHDHPALMRFAKIDYAWAERISVSKLEFQNIAFEALRLAATDSFRGSGVNPDAGLKTSDTDMKHSPMAQRLRCLRLALFSPSAWAGSPSSSLHNPQLRAQSAGLARGFSGQPGQDFWQQDRQDQVHEFFSRHRDQLQQGRLRREAIRSKAQPAISFSLNGTRVVVEKLHRQTVI